MTARPRRRCGGSGRREAEVVRLARKTLCHAVGGGSASVENLRPRDDRRSGVEVRSAPSTVADDVELGDRPRRLSLFLFGNFRYCLTRSGFHSPLHADEHWRISMNLLCEILMHFY